MARGGMHTQKVTISLAQDLLNYADQQAKALGSSRSQIIGRALAELRAREADALAREGYAFYAREAEEFAAASLAASSEAMSHDG
jgi:metal-responsive CopG/Arc/MetJ family transcriptional regulator